MAHRLVWLEKKHGDPQFFSCIILLGRKANNYQNVMPFFWKMRKCRIFRFVFGITEFFIFCVMKVFSGAIQHAKFEHRSPDKIERYRSYSSIVIEATYPRIRGKRGKIDKMFFCCGLWQLFFENFTALFENINYKMELES
jgi:hypothetical protein